MFSDRHFYYDVLIMILKLMKVPAELETVNGFVLSNLLMQLYYSTFAFCLIDDRHFLDDSIFDAREEIH